MTDRRPQAISRRRLAGAVGAAGVAGAAGLGVAPAAVAREQAFRSQGGGDRWRRPNILVILADDLGWADLSSYGAPDIQTPHLDRLAASGVRFTQGYSASAVCSPNRVALYTGRLPARIPGGVPEPIPAPSPEHGIPVDHPTLATQLSAAGYSTAMIGKWHAGFLPWFGPLKSGWEEFFGSYSGGVDYFSKVTHYGAGVHDLYEGEEEFDDDRYYTDILAERAAAFVSRDHDAPWLLNLNLTSPHWPWETRGDRAVSDELTARSRAGEPRVLFHEDGGSRETYREMVEDLDAAIGRVLRALRRSGQLDDTLVLFASDNGGERFSYQWPLRGSKGDVFEGGIRVPTILSWPDRIRGRQVSHEPVHTLDWTATLLEVAGARPDPAYPLDGRSLVDYLLRGRPLAQRDLFWRMRGQRALRRGDLKYVQADGVDHLYDLAADVSEQADLARRRPDDLAALRGAWEAVDAGLLPYPA